MYTLPKGPTRLTCRHTTSQTILQSPKSLYTIRDRFTCQSVNVVCSIISRRCGCLYIGETERRLRERFGEHLRSIWNNSRGFPVAKHFNSAFHSLNDIMICGLKRWTGYNTRRKKQEMRLIFELGNWNTSLRTPSPRTILSPTTRISSMKNLVNYQLTVWMIEFRA